MKKIIFVSILVALFLCSCSQSDNTKKAESSSVADEVTSTSSLTEESIDTSYKIVIDDKIYYLSNRVLSDEERAYIDEQASDTSSARYFYDPAQQAEGTITDVKTEVFSLDHDQLCMKIKCSDLYNSVKKLYDTGENDMVYIVLEPAGKGHLTDNSLPDSSEISAYYIYRWYGEVPYEITNRETIDKITAWIENAESVCEDYPAVDGPNYGGADAYGISLEKVGVGEAHENICNIDVSQYSWEETDGRKVCNFLLTDEMGEVQEYNLPKEMIDEIIPLITRPNVE